MSLDITNNNQPENISKITVLHIIDELRRGGKERQFVELLKGLDRSAFSIHTICFLERQDGYDEQVKELSSKFSYFLRKYRWDLFLIIELIKYCRRESIDIIYVWDGMTAFYGYFASLFSRTKFVNGSIRDTDTRRTYRHLIKRWILNISGNIVANSQAGLDAYDIKNRGLVIYNGLDLNRFNQIRTRNDDKFVVGIVASLSEYKDFYTFFDAIKTIQEKINNLEVHIIGAGKLAEEYKEYAVKIGVNQEILKYIGRVSNTENYIPNFDVGVLCSYKQRGEGLSNSVIEYMACEVAVVITDIGAAREIVTNNENGFLFEAGNPIDLSEKIFNLYKDEELRKKIATSGKDSVKDKFSFTQFVKENEKYYKSLI